MGDGCTVQALTKKQPVLYEQDAVAAEGGGNFRRKLCLRAAGYASIVMLTAIKGTVPLSGNTIVKSYCTSFWPTIVKNC